MATRGGAQVALQQSLILRPGNNQCIKNLNREGGHFWIVARGHFSVGITKFLGIIYKTLKNGWVFEDFPAFVLAPATG